MVRAKVIRYIVYILLAMFVIWIINISLTAYYGMKADISEQNLNQVIKTLNLKWKEDSVFNTKVKILVKSKKFDAAINELKKREKLFPATKDLFYVDIGDVYKLKNDLDSAYIYYSIAISSDIYNVNAHVKRGEIYLKKNNLKAAINDFQIAADNNFDYYYVLGELQTKEGDLKKAKASLDSFLKYYPRSKMGRLKLDSIERKMNVFSHKQDIH